MSIETALIEKPNDKNAKTLLEMAELKQRQAIEVQKRKENLQLLRKQFEEFMLIYNDNYFKEFGTEESVEYLMSGLRRVGKLELILTEILSIEFENDLAELKDDFETIINQEIEAIMSNMVMYTARDIDLTDPNADPLNQYGKAVGGWLSSMEKNNTMVPILQKNFKVWTINNNDA